MVAGAEARRGGMLRPSGGYRSPTSRLPLYVRLARAADSAALDSLEEELIDRFGALPPEAETLLAMLRIGMLARHAGIARIDAGPAAIALTPRKECAADFQRRWPDRKGNALASCWKRRPKRIGWTESISCRRRSWHSADHLVEIQVAARRYRLAFFWSSSSRTLAVSDR